MKDTCSKCHQPDPGGPREIQFGHAGLTFSVFKSGLKCEKCAADETRQRFDRCAVGVIKAEDGVPVVDWGQYKQLGERSLFERQKEICLILKGLGVFSTRSQGNWCIVSDTRIQVSPGAGLGLLMSFFFARREWAEGYARAALARTQYGWEIHHVDTVLSKEEVLK